MSQKLCHKGHVQRKQYLQQHYGLKTIKEMSVSCGVHTRTLDRDIREWKDSGDYDEWLDQRWHELLEDRDIDKRTKFLALTRLKEKRLVRRSQTTTEHKGQIIIKAWNLGDANSTGDTA